jgi:MATE family multidrug resistance protein
MILGQRLGASGLEGFTTALAVYNVCVISLGFGILTALDTLVAQAYGRNPTSKEIGELTQRGLFLTLILCLPCLFFLSYSHPLLLYFFSPKLASAASAFLSNAHLLFLLTLCDYTLSMVIACCRQTHIPLVSAAASAFTAFVGSYFFLDSIPRVAHILVVAHGVQCSVLILFVLFHPALQGIRKAQWFPLPAFHRVFNRARLAEYLKLAIPGLVASCAEWWAFEFMMILAGALSDTDAGIISICFAVLTICYVIPAALAGSASTAIGNALGANDAELARATKKAAIASSIVVQVATTTLMLVGGRSVYQLWTRDGFLLSQLLPLTPLLTFCVTLDGVQHVLQGLYDGVGYQDRASKRVLVSLWGVGVLSALILSKYFDMGAWGILVSLALGLAVETPLLIAGAIGWDWDQLAMEASMEREESELEAAREEGELEGQHSESAPIVKVGPGRTAADYGSSR